MEACLNISSLTRLRRLCGLTTIVLIILPSMQLFAADCESVAHLVSLEGAIEYKTADTEDWQTATLEQKFCSGDALRSGRDSRAAIRMINDTLLRFDHSTAIIFTSVVQKERSLLDLLKGAVHFISRVPRSLEIKTPYLNAAIEGTEFVVTVKDDSTEVTVYEGTVVVRNDSGSIDLTTSQTGSAASGQAPVRIVVAHPRDAVAWALYYPPLPGQQDQAGSLAHQTIDAIVKNDIDRAATLAKQAIAMNPQSAAAFMAQSYVDQARFNIPAALKHSRKATELAPGDAITQARLAEVLLMTGDTKAARAIATDAVQLNPSLAHTQTVLGFSSLRTVNLADAKAAFEKAIQLDSAAPLPRLGLGLVKIRRGDLKAGREEIETAALLDPNNALLRSYMGKAYYEEKRGELASEQFAMAKDLDPNDPTAWFYDSILLQTSNQPVNALEEINAAIARNDNRAVYRSNQLLDEDNASRNISLARIYDDLGFKELAVVEAAKSLNEDPANHSAHRLIADSFATRPRHEIARASEFLQSQLLQPLNINPAQPRLAETNLNIVPGLVPLQSGFNEYNPLFDRNRTLFTLSGIGGTQDTIGDEITVSGIQNNIGYSLGQFHFETDGFHNDNDAEYDVYNFFLQADPSARSSIQAEVRYSEAKFGNLTQSILGVNPLQDNENDEENTSIRLGGHIKSGINSDWLISAIYSKEKGRLNIDKPRIIPDDGVIFTNETRIKSDLESYSYETQYLKDFVRFNITTGLGFYQIDGDETRLTVLSLTDLDGNILFPPSPGVPKNTSKDTDFYNAYFYTNYFATESLTITAGISADKIDNENASDKDQINPKFGLSWDVSSDTTIRAAAFQTLKRDLINNQTIEPSQVAGFNQFFDDLNGADSRRYNIAIDHQFSGKLFAGAELSKRDLESPFARGSKNEVDSDEYLHRAYLYWTPTQQISLGGEYNYEQMEVEFIPGNLDFTFPNKTTTQTTPIFINYFHPKGWFTKLTSTYVDQEVDFPNSTGGTDTHNDQFWLVDASLGYRFPKRSGIVSIEARNLLDKSFNFQETDLFGNPRLPRFQPEASVFLRFTMNY